MIQSAHPGDPNRGDANAGTQVVVDYTDVAMV